MESAAPGAVSSIQRTPAGRIFFLRREPSENQFKLVWRDGVNGADTVIVDPEVISKASEQRLAVLDYRASPDGRAGLHASGGWQRDRGAARRRCCVGQTGHRADRSHSLFPGNLARRQQRLLLLAPARGFDKLPSTERFGDRTRYFRSIKGGDHRPVFSPTLNAELKLPIYARANVFQIPGTQTAACVVSLGVERYQLAYVAPLADAIAGRAKWRQLVEVKDKAASISFTPDAMYLRTSSDAPRYKVMMRVMLANPDLAKAETIVAPGRDVVVSLAAAQDALYVTSRHGVTTTLLRVAHRSGARAEEVALPVSGSASLVDADVRLPGTVVSLAGWTRTSKPYYPARPTEVGCARVCASWRL